MLTLSDYKKIYTKFCFLDESGDLMIGKSPFFTIGFIKCAQPYYIMDQISKARDKAGFYDEIKFNKVSKNNIDFAKIAIDILFSTKSLSFYSYSTDKDGPFFRRHFSGDPWTAYEAITIKILESTIAPNGIVFVVADYVTTPKHIKFEIVVKRKVNDNLKRLAVAGICRFDSKSNDVLQLTDLIIGAINYDLKLSTGVILRGSKHKRRLSEHLKNKLKIKDFTKGFKGYHKKYGTFLNIFVDKDILRRLATPTTPII